MTDSNNNYADVLVAKNYKYRPPYHPRFIEDIANEVCLKKTDSSLDLLCGQGEISRKISNYCNSVVAVDGASEMLDLSTRAPNIKYLRGDVNGPNFIDVFNGETFSHCFVGRAIHWIDEISLTEIRKRLLTKSAWLVTMQGGYSRSNPWWKKYKDVIDHYSTGGPSVDYVSREKIVNSGFTFVKPFAFYFKLKLDVNFLYGSAMSYRPTTTLELNTNEAEVKAELKAELDSFLVDGYLIAVISNSAFIYKS